MSFKISFNTEIRERLLELHADATQFGQGDAFQNALRALEERLRTNPLGAGEIRFRLSQGEPVLVAAQAPVVVGYAVYAERGIVWLHRVHRLASANE